MSGPDAIDRWLSFIFAHRDERGAPWVEVGRYVTLPVSFSMRSDFFSLIVDSDLTVAGFGQSVGLYIPRELLDNFIDGPAREYRKYVAKPIPSHRNRSQGLWIRFAFLDTTRITCHFSCAFAALCGLTLR